MNIMAAVCAASLATTDIAVCTKPMDPDAALACVMAYNDHFPFNRGMGEMGALTIFLAEHAPDKTGYLSQVICQSVQNPEPAQKEQHQ